MDSDLLYDDSFTSSNDISKNYERAHLRKGDRPTDRTPIGEACRKFSLSLMKSVVSADISKIHRTFIPAAYLPCVTPTAELTSIDIRHLQLETHHRKKYIVLRSLMPCKRMTGILALMEDDNGDAVLVQLYHQEAEIKRKSTDIIRMGTIILVKEPYYKVMSTGEYGIRVDHLSDVRFLEVDDIILPLRWKPRITDIEQSVTDWKGRGDQAVRTDDHWNAIKFYSSALRLPTTREQIESIRCKRAIAYLKIEEYDNALLDTAFPEIDIKSSEDILYSASQALYSLGRYLECYDMTNILSNAYPKNKRNVIVHDRARCRVEEQEKATYNFKRLQVEARILRPPHLDCATYVGPVETKQTEHKGRGLFLTSHVKAGDLLLCEKAFSHAYTDAANPEVYMPHNLETKQYSMGLQAALVESIVQKLFHNPSQAKVVRGLYRGSYESTDVQEVDSLPVVDSFLVDKVVSYNAFESPMSCLETYRKLRNIRDENLREEDDTYRADGLWPQASYINHSCTSNAFRAFIGDIMIVRAARDIDEGAEITFWYFNPSRLGTTELQKMFKNWEFECDCAVCGERKAMGTKCHAKRIALKERTVKVFDSSISGKLKVKQVEGYLRQLNKTYQRPAEDVPRLLLWKPQLSVAKAYSRLSDNSAEKVLESVAKALIAVGFVVEGLDISTKEFEIIKWGIFDGLLVEAFMLARDAFADSGALGNAKRAEEYARIAFKISVGEDSSFEIVDQCR